MCELECVQKLLSQRAREDLNSKDPIWIEQLRRQALQAHRQVTCLIASATLSSGAKDVVCVCVFLAGVCGPFMARLPGSCVPALVSRSVRVLPDGGNLGGAVLRPHSTK